MTVRYLPFIQRRLDEFLPLVRVGVDFGEHAGGIAVVKGTEILHAETYLDFHDTDLETRRRLRRGRRTRHAKRMRLARLRSWALRQRFSDGSRLPDPYWILSEQNKQYWVQPGIYQTKGKDPKAAPSWIDLAKRGEVDAAGFVRALTLIFKKRGYKFDDRTFGEMSDIELKKFLQTARIPPEVSELREDMQLEIQRRDENPDDPVRGRKKVSPTELRELFNTACARLPQPRIAEHRSVKEADLRAVIEGFGRSAGLSQDTIVSWNRELVGEKSINGNRAHYGLLNKVLRPARFDNRIKSTCSWCEKKTPRRFKVREFAYKAVVNNLRAREGWRDRPLNEGEKNEFLGWWIDRSKAPGLATIKKRLRLLNPRQGGMANQVYNLLKNDKPPGRVNLCKEHLEMAANGKTMKDAGLDWQTMRIRNAPNPKREDHDKRVLHRLEQILFVKGKHGPDAWRYGPVSLISLEVPEPQTERTKPGQVTERKEESFGERLVNELDGKCTYCENTAVDKDHIYPRSKGGPDLWDNLIAACKACNDAKGDRTPFEWFGSNGLKWAAFTKRVETLPISPRKKTLLTNTTADFPGGDPTPLARVGSRPRQFVADLSRLFASYGVPRPQLNYEIGKCHAQLVRGRLTWRLRHSWLIRSDGEKNFPRKDDFDLYNHAQDAALVAACPPHTWRDQIFVFEAKRPNAKGELVMRPGLAIPELAPSWATFIKNRTGSLLRVLGNYPITWKKSLFKETLWQGVERTDDKELVVYKQVADLTVGELKKIVSPYYRERLESQVKELGLGERKSIPPEILKREFPGLVRLKLTRQKPSGVIVTFKGRRGPLRKLVAAPESASEGAVFWVFDDGRRGQFKISIIRPRPLQALGVPRLDPPLPAGAKRVGSWVRHQIIQLPIDAKGKHPAGWYRVKEFSESDIVVLPENALPAEISRRMELGNSRAVTERRLGKTELQRYFTPSKDNP